MHSKTTRFRISFQSPEMSCTRNPIGLPETAAHIMRFRSSLLLPQMNNISYRFRVPPRLMFSGCRNPWGSLPPTDIAGCFRTHPSITACLLLFLPTTTIDAVVVACSSPTSRPLHPVYRHILPSIPPIHPFRPPTCPSALTPSCHTYLGFSCYSSFRILRILPSLALAQNPVLPNPVPPCQPRALLSRSRYTVHAHLPTSLHISPARKCEYQIGVASRSPDSGARPTVSSPRVFTDSIYPIPAPSLTAIGSTEGASGKNSVWDVFREFPISQSVLTRFT
jgi:hypothetical protein